MSDFSTKVISYIGCEVRMSDCYETKIEKIPNCEHWESLSDDTKKALRLADSAKFCGKCQEPIDRSVTRKVLKFWAKGKEEAEANPEGHWPRILGSATDKAEGTVRGYRVFPVFEKGTIRRDVVIYGLPLWSVTSGYNGDYPETPPSTKYDEVKRWFNKLGIMHEPSFKLRLYFAQEPKVKAKPVNDLTKPPAPPGVKYLQPVS